MVIGMGWRPVWSEWVVGGTGVESWSVEWNGDLHGQNRRENWSGMGEGCVERKMKFNLIKWFFIARVIDYIYKPLNEGSYRSE